MSVSQFPKCAAINDSSIPIPKRNSGGLKKPRKCAQLPELQKYIETIIKASNEYDSEDTSLSEKERFPKERKFGTYSVFKGLENKDKQEKNKSELTLTRSKNNFKAKTPLTEAVSRGVKVYNTFAPEFEDPRNWKLGNNPNLGPRVEIEKFLKEFYPNPYQLESVIEFKQSKNKKDELRDGTLPDVVISDANIHNDVGIEKRDNDLVTADAQTCTREDKTLKQTSDASPENQSPPSSENKNVDAKSVEDSTPGLLENSSTIKGNNSRSNRSSRTSSPESTISDTLSKGNQLKNRKNNKNKSRHEALIMEKASDYDIGKLELLNLTDSEKSLRVDKTKNSVDDGKSRNLDEIENTYASEEFNELKEIYDIMHKATESFLILDTKNNRSLECNAVAQELNASTEVNNSAKTKLDTNESDKIEKEIYSSKEEKNSDNSFLADENKIPQEERKTIGKSLINVLLDDKFEPTPKQADGGLEQERTQTEVVSEYDMAALEPPPKEISEEDQDFAATNQKIDEVLDFMYNCLRKFNRGKSKGESKPVEEQKISRKECEKRLLKSASLKRFSKDGITDINDEKATTSVIFGQSEFACARKESSTGSHLGKAFPDINEIKSKYTAALGEISKKASKSRFRKKSSLFFPANDQPSHQIPVSRTPTPANTSTQPQSDQQQVEEVYENSVLLAMQTVESQNELGGYAEETQEPLLVNGDTRIPKPICPLSAKRKKSKTNNTKKLKDVLEAEEKLLSVESVGKDLEEKVSEKPKDLVICKSQTQDQLQNESPKIYSQFSDFKRPSTNFLICLNSFPHNMTSLTSIQQNVPLQLSTSFMDLKKDWNFRKLMLYPTYPMKKVPVRFEAGHKVLQCTYNIKQGASLMFSKTATMFTAQPLCMKLIFHHPKSGEPFSIQKSLCLANITVRPKQVPAPSTEGATALKLSLSPSEVLPEEEKPVKALIEEIEKVEEKPVKALTEAIEEVEEKPVKALIEAIEEAEEKVFMLEQNSAENLDSRNTDLNSLNVTEIKNEYSETEAEKINDRKKIQELLVRTYNLQQKLQRYLQKVSYVQPISMSSVSVHEGVLDFRTSEKTTTEVCIKSEISLPTVHWHLKSPESDVVLRADESVKGGTSMIDNSTSYDPPPQEEIYGKADDSDQEDKLSPPKDTNARVFQDFGNDHDDRSSIYSFKSSNDNSEQGEFRYTKKELKHSEYKSNKKLFRKIFNEIESFRQSFEAGKVEKHPQGDACPQAAEEPEEKRLVQYDPKIPAKVLRTVFTGKKSSTELTIGLKDVPMTKLGNISVEKTKFSPNHTKISVAFMTETEPQNKAPPYFYEHTRQSLSTCLTEMSGMKDEDSKTFQNLNEESEDEDDFKSVASTIGNSDSEVEKEDKLDTKQETAEMPPPKNYVKHRFDFYRKMDTDLDAITLQSKSPTNSVCRYKELEPLKQALTEMQIRMRNIRRDAVYSSHDYYERALKLAKMSAGFCQSCGNRAVIPNDTFGYYKSLLPRRSTQRRNRHFRSGVSPNPSFYSIRSSKAEVGSQFCELGIKHSSYTLNPRLNSNRTILRSSLQDMPVLFERM